MCSTLLRFSHRCYQMWSKFLRDQILVDQINCSRLIGLLPSKLWGLWRERSDLVHPGGRKEMGAIKSCEVIPHDSTDLYRIAFNHNLTFLPPSDIEYEYLPNLSRPPSSISNCLCLQLQKPQTLMPKISAPREPREAFGICEAFTTQWCNFSKCHLKRWISSENSTV